MTALTDFETIDAARAYEETTYSDMSTSVLNAYIGGYGLSDFVSNLTDDKGVMLNATRAVNGKFDFDEGSTIGASNIAYMDFLIESYTDYSDILEAFKDDVIEFCKTVTYPFSETTTLQWNRANGIYSAITYTDFDTTLNVEVTGCEERCQAAVYGISDEYDEYQNLGIVAWGTTKFVFNLAGVRFTSLEIRIPFEGVEVV